MTSSSNSPAAPKRQQASSRRQAGFAEEAARSFNDTHPNDGRVSAVLAAIERSRSIFEVRARTAAEAKSKTEAAHREAHHLKVANIKKWSVARGKLLSVVLDIDRVIQAEGMSLGMVDFATHPCDVAAVQIQVAVLGRPSDAVLEIVVGGELAQRARVVASRGNVLLPALPTVPRTTLAQYFAAVLAYLEAAIPERVGREAITCRKCGMFIPALDAGPIR